MMAGTAAPEPLLMPEPLPKIRFWRMNSPVPAVTSTAAPLLNAMTFAAPLSDAGPPRLLPGSEVMPPMVLPDPLIAIPRPFEAEVPSPAMPT